MAISPYIPIRGASGRRHRCCSRCQQRWQHERHLVSARAPAQRHGFCVRSRPARLRRSVPDHPPSAWVSRSGGQEPRERKFIDDRRERGHRRATLCAGVTRPPRSVFLRFALEDDRKARRGHVTSSRDQAAAGCHPSWHPHWVAMPAHYGSAPRRRSSPLALNRAGFRDAPASVVSDDGSVTTHPHLRCVRVVTYRRSWGAVAARAGTS